MMERPLSEMVRNQRPLTVDPRDYRRGHVQSDV